MIEREQGQTRATEARTKGGKDTEEKQPEYCVKSKRKM